MQRFRRRKTPQKFASVHAVVFNHFNPERHFVSRQTYKRRFSEAFSEWGSVIANPV
jgi:putative transposase